MSNIFMCLIHARHYPKDFINILHLFFMKTFMSRYNNYKETKTEQS